MIGKCCQNVRIRWGWTTSLPLKMTCKVYVDQKKGIWNETTRTSQLVLLIDPKSDSSMSKVDQNNYLDGQKLYKKRSYTQCHLKEDLMLWSVNRHPPIGNEGRRLHVVQKMTQCQVISKMCLPWTQNLDYPQRFLLRVVAHLVPQTHLFFKLLQISGRDFF
jgi:hypothetical protein